jgi:hypothetical protein
MVCLTLSGRVFGRAGVWADGVVALIAGFGGFGGFGCFFGRRSRGRT